MTITTIPKQLHNVKGITIGDKKFCVINDETNQIDMYYKLTNAYRTYTYTYGRKNVFVKFSFQDKDLCKTVCNEENINNIEINIKNHNQLQEIKMTLLCLESNTWANTGFQELHLLVGNKDFDNIKLTKIYKNYLDTKFFSERIGTQKQCHYEPIFWILFENDREDLCKTLLSSSWKGYEERLVYLRYWYDQYSSGKIKKEEVKKYFNETPPTLKEFLQKNANNATEQLTEDNKRLKEEKKKLESANKELEKKVNIAEKGLKDAKLKNEEQKNLLTNIRNYYNETRSSICFSCIPSLSEADIRELNKHLDT